MKPIFTFLFKSIFLLLGYFIFSTGCAQQNPTVKYKAYQRTFLADTYPKSITDYYRQNNNIAPELSDREVAILVTCEIELDDLINYFMFDELNQQKNNISESSFEQAKTKMQVYHKAQHMDRTDGFIINRTKQWLADSLIQSKYGGRIYYDEREMIVKPKEAYLRMLLELIAKNEIIITDEFMKNAMIKMLTDEINNYPSLSCDFYRIETWPVIK